MILKYKSEVYWNDAGGLNGFAMQVFLITFPEPVKKVGNNWLFAEDLKT